MDYLKRAVELQNEAVEIRRTLHRIPEIGFELPKTTSFIKKKLEEYGCSYEEPVKCGLVVNIGNGNGKTILIRADIDALPQPELTDLPFRAENGNSHSCGHDIHTTAQLICAKMLKENEENVNGTVKLIFQPDEEAINGAIAMIDAGCLENPHVDAAISLHTKAKFPAGKFNVGPGNYLCSSDIFTVKVYGKSAHGSAPETGIDPVNIACKIVDAVQTVQTREVDSLDPNVITFGSIHGGTAPNIIPEEVELQGTIRCFTKNGRPKVIRRFREVVEGTAAVFGGKAEVIFESQTPITYNDPELTADIRRYLSEMVGADMVGDETGIKGSDDFAYYSEKVPGVMYHVGTGVPEDGYIYTLHNPHITFDERCIPNACASFAEITTRWLDEHR